MERNVSEDVVLRIVEEHLDVLSGSLTPETELPEDLLEDPLGIAVLVHAIEEALLGKGIDFGNKLPQWTTIGNILDSVEACTLKPSAP